MDFTCATKKQRCSREAQAQCILRKFFFKFIKPCSLMLTAQRFSDTGLCLEEAKCIPFTELSNKLCTIEVLDTSGDMLLRFMQLCNWKRGMNPLITGTVNVKIFLACYMIAARPTHVFESPEEDLEKKLLECSEPFLACFHEAVDALRQGKGWAFVKQRGLDQRLATSMCLYLRRFKVRF